MTNEYQEALEVLKDQYYVIDDDDEIEIIPYEQGDVDRQVIIYDYLGKPYSCEVEDFDKVKEMRIDLCEGDEVLRVLYKYGRRKEFNFLTRDETIEQSYAIYRKGINLLDDEYWTKSDDTYLRCEYGKVGNKVGDKVGNKVGKVGDKVGNKVGKALKREVEEDE